MAVSISDVRAVAALARLALAPAEEERLVGELNQILRYMDKLNELDTAGVAPTSHPVPMRQLLREDVVEPFQARESLLAVAPHRDGEHYRVPRIID